MNRKRMVLRVAPMALLLVILLCGCRFRGTVKNAEVDLGTSKTFSQEELQAAADCAMKDFKKNFPDCDLQKLYYDEEMSDQMSVLSQNDPNYADITQGNSIMLWGDFTTGDHPSEGFSANQSYPGYHWLLIRDDADSPWRVDSYGGGWA